MTNGGRSLGSVRGAARKGRPYRDRTHHRIIERRCDDTWRNIRDDLGQIKLAHLSTPNGQVWQVTDPWAEAAKRLKQLGILPPPPLLHLA